MSVCNHVLACTGIDPAGPWRGTYDDETGAQAIYDAHGGVQALFRHGMALAGIPEGPAAPMAAVICRVGAVEIAGVDLGPRVAFMVEGRGMMEMRAPIVAAWPV